MLQEKEAALIITNTISPDIDSSPSRRIDLIIVVVLCLLALVVRIYSVQFYHVISTDGTTYANVAKQILSGNFSGVAISGIYPVLIAGAGLIIKDLELAGRVVSIIFGTAILFPLYHLGKELFSRNAAVMACIIAIVHPSFVWFSCEVMTQSAYVTIQLTGIYLVWRLFSKPAVKTGVLAGALVGITYMTRPEGLLLFFALPFFPLLFNLRRTIEKWQPAAAYTATFSMFFLLNILLVYKATGELQISAKTDSALNDALSYYLNIPDLGYVPGYVPKNYLEILRDHPDFLPKNIIKNTMTAWNTILPSWQWLLLVAGLITGGWSREVAQKKFFLLATFSPLVVIITFYYIDTSYTLSYLPVMLLLVASPLCAAEKLLLLKLPVLEQNRLFAAVPLSVILTLFYGILLLAPQIRDNVPDEEYWSRSDEGRRAQKFIGHVIRDYLPPGKIMTRWARVAFYSEREWDNIPAGIYLEEIVALARKQGVRYLIADGLTAGNRPGMGEEIFAPLLDESVPLGVHLYTDVNYRIRGLFPYLVYKHPRSIGAVIYDLSVQ